MTRKTRRARLREQAAAARAATTAAANSCEKRADQERQALKPASSLTPRRLKFALVWAEADPEDRLQDLATRAGYSESVARSGMVAELCRDPAIIEVRDRRLLELQHASSVTVEETLIGLRDLARDPAVPPKDRVAARRALLGWYARDKGQHAPPGAGASGRGQGTDGGSEPAAVAQGMTAELRTAIASEVLGVPRTK